jgi:hypothetical protein
MCVYNKEILLYIFIEYIIMDAPKGAIYSFDKNCKKKKKKIIWRSRWLFGDTDEQIEEL